MVEFETLEINLYNLLPLVSTRDTWDRLTHLQASTVNASDAEVLAVPYGGQINTHFIIYPFEDILIKNANNYQRCFFMDPKRNS